LTWVSVAPGDNRLWMRFAFFSTHASISAQDLETGAYFITSFSRKCAETVAICPIRTFPSLRQPA
jgi:hypothetical protein